MLSPFAVVVGTNTGIPGSHAIEPVSHSRCQVSVAVAGAPPDRPLVVTNTPASPTAKRTSGSLATNRIPDSRRIVSV